MLKFWAMSGTSARSDRLAGAGARWGILPLLSASVIWGTSGTAQALAQLHADPPLIGAARLLSGAAALVVIAAVTGRLRVRELLAADRRRWLLTAGFATAVYQAAFFGAVARTGVALGTLVALGSAPAFCGLFARRFGGESLPRAWTLSTACAVAGCALVVLPHGGGGGADPFGIALSVVAGGCYGAYTVCVKRLLGTGADPIPVLAVTVSIGAVLLSPFLFTGAGALASPAGLLLTAWLGLVVTAGAYVLFARGLARVPARTAGTVSLAEPLTATVLGALVLAESWTLTTAAGGLLIAVGLACSVAGPGPRAAGAGVRARTGCVEALVGFPTFSRSARAVFPRRRRADRLPRESTPPAPAESTQLEWFDAASVPRRTG